ncbi:hypothetical protein PG984_016054 [Apiospora sp. TS-2023a]
MSTKSYEGQQLNWRWVALPIFSDIVFALLGPPKLQTKIAGDLARRRGDCGPPSLAATDTAVPPHFPSRPDLLGPPDHPKGLSSGKSQQVAHVIETGNTRHAFQLQHLRNLGLELQCLQGARVWIDSRMLIVSSEADIQTHQCIVMHLGANPNQGIKCPAIVTLTNERIGWGPMLISSPTGIVAINQLTTAIANAYICHHANPKDGIIARQSSGYSRED